jgi:hypothetical protein
MVNVAETGHQPGFAMVDFGMVRHQPVFRAGGSMARFTASASWLALSPVRHERAGAENRDIGAVARHQRQRGAAGEQPLLTVPLAAKQDELDIGAVANSWAISSEAVITVMGPFSWLATASSALRRRETASSRRDARGDLLAETLLGSEQGVSSLARHRRDVKRDGAAVAFLQYALVFQLAEIPAYGIGRHLQRINQFADAQLTGFTQPVEDVFLSGELMHDERLRKLTQ